MNRLLYPISIVPLLFLVNSSIGQSAMVSTGNTAQGSGGKLYYTIGQVADMRLIKSAGRVEQGVQQPAPFFVPLPMTGVNLAGQCNNGLISLYWLDQLTIKKTTIQRSQDGLSWQDDQTLKNNQTKDSVQWADKNPFTKETYYRLRLESNDNTIRYSNTLLLLNCDRSLQTISISPNPTTFGFYIELNDFTGVSYSLYTIDGKQVIKDVFHENLSFIEINHLPAAEYLLTISKQQHILKSTIIIKN